MNFNVKDWTTTAIGVGLGGANLLLQGVNWQSVLISVAAAFLGALAKDPKFSTAVPTEMLEPPKKRKKFGEK